MTPYQIIVEARVHRGQEMVKDNKEEEANARYVYKSRVCISNCG
jgi:hypothetical protein